MPADVVHDPESAGAMDRLLTPWHVLYMRTKQSLAMRNQGKTLPNPELDGIFTRIVDSLDRLPTLPEDMTGIPLIEQRVRKMKFIRTMSNLVIATLLGTLKEIVRTLKGRRTRASNLDFKNQEMARQSH